VLTMLHKIMFMQAQVILGRWHENKEFVAAPCSPCSRAATVPVAFIEAVTLDAAQLREGRTQLAMQF